MLLLFCSVMNRIRKRADIVVAFTQEYSRVSYPLRNVSILSKTFIHPRTPHYRRGMGQRGFLWLRIEGKVELTSCLLRIFAWIKPEALIIKLLSYARTWRVTKALNRAVTTCRIPLETVGWYNKQQVESSLNTTSTPFSTNSRFIQDYPFLSGILL